MSLARLEAFGRERLSRTFFMREFLHSEISQTHGIPNIPEELDLALAAGRQLCETLLEPLQDHFGRIAIRSAYRSREVAGFGSAKKLSCASNERNAAHHIWDLRDKDGLMGATACVVVTSFADRYQAPGDWQKLAWWIHDHLPYASLCFFPKFWAVNVQWHEKPQRVISSYAAPNGTLTRPGMANHAGSHAELYEGLPAFRGI